MYKTGQAYIPTPRIQHLRKRVMDQVPELFSPGFRGYYFIEGWTSADGQSMPLRYASGLSNVIENMPVKMIPGDLLVGEHGSPGTDWTEYYNFWPVTPGDFEDRLSISSLTDDQKDQLRSWMGDKPFRWQTLSPVAPWPSEMALASEHGVISVWGTDLNHSIRDYEKVLKKGFAGIRSDVETALRNLSLHDPDAACKRANLLGWLRICDAAISLGSRYADLAEDNASSCDDPDQRLEWVKIADVCRRVPAQPASTFKEALQSLWFAHMITVWEDGVNANGIGRLDQFLWPYLERDLDDGRITWDEAAELLSALWVKLYQTYDVQQMMIGGQLPDGSDAVNPLSYLVLDVTEGMDFVRCLSARLHKDSPREFVSRCVDLIAKGGGIPFFFNDDALVPALVSRGVPVEDARGYAAIGCIEITIPGKANPHAVSNWINLAKCLELAINDGRDLIDDVQVGPNTGTLADFKTIDELLNAYTAQFEYFADWAVYGSNMMENAHRHQYRLPYLSLLTDDCISKGKDIIEGGARYNYHSSAAVGVPNIADSLASLKTAVFDDNLVSPSDMLNALRDNFSGKEDLRLYLKNRMPKYGNDDLLVDTFASDIVSQYCKQLDKYEAPNGGNYFVHLFTFTLMISMGKQTGASPDGRLSREPLAYSLSPAQGRDKEGLTAVINSLSRIPHHLAAASSSAILEADPKLLEGPGREAFVDLLITAVKQGVGQMQFNVVSADTLREAQRNPERYSNLCVRVSGFSQQFSLLDREMQDHIIARTKHTR
ncbi:MAG: pyruvate formate lyase family protein [Armatimonadota bacterium]